MADKGNADTFVYTIAGREMTFLRTTRTQLLMLQRMLMRMQEEMHAVADDSPKVIELTSKLADMMFEAAESRFTDPLDLMFVQREILRGNVDQPDIMGILANGQRPEDPPADDEDPPAKVPRKTAAAKKAAKKVASPRRVTR